MTKDNRAVEIQLRSAGAIDREFIRKLSGEAFAHFGDYETLLPQLLVRRWVHTILAETGDQPIGYAMYTFEGTPEGEADLLAIAVIGTWQSRGVGRLLLAQIERDVSVQVGATGPPAVRLTVALNNAPARRLFERAGYAYLGDERGSYPAGQRSIGMRKLLASEVG